MSVPRDYQIIKRDGIYNFRFRDPFIGEIMSGKSSRLRNRDAVRLTKELDTTVEWLMNGAGLPIFLERLHDLYHELLILPNEHLNKIQALVSTNYSKWIKIIKSNQKEFHYNHSNWISYKIIPYKTSTWR